MLNIWLPFLSVIQFSVCGPICCRGHCLRLLKTVLGLLCSFLTSSNSFCFTYASFLMNKKAHGDSSGSLVYVIHQENFSSFLSANSQCGDLSFINLSTIFYIFLHNHQDYSRVLYTTGFKSLEALSKACMLNTWMCLIHLVFVTTLLAFCYLALFIAVRIG